MKFGRAELARPLLALRANRGCRYVIARVVATGEPWFVSIDPDGGMSGQPVDREIMGASTAPFETWVAAGRVPGGAARVEVELDGERFAGKARAGLWLAGIPWQARDLEVRIRFLSRDGAMVAERDEQLVA